MEDVKFLTKLSQNLLEILSDDEFCDVNIEVGNESQVKIFRAHMVILNYRSPYLRRLLSKNKKKNDEDLSHILIPNIQPDMFQILLKYIYGGALSLKEYDISSIVKILITANELAIQELITHIQSFLIENNASWIKDNFNLIYQISFESDSFIELQKFCTSLLAPEKIYNTLNFSSIPEKTLISLIQDSNLKMSEIQVWNCVLKWGLAQNPELPSNITNFSKEHIDILKNTLQPFIPFIEFYSLTFQEFMEYVLPYRDILPEDLFMNLSKTLWKLNQNNGSTSKTETYNSIEPNSNSETYDLIEPNGKSVTIELSGSEFIKSSGKSESIGSSGKSESIDSNGKLESIESIESSERSESIESSDKTEFCKSIEPSGKLETCKNIESNIIAIKHADLISKWIDRIDITNNSTSTYEFKLILRGTRDGFEKFHEVCDAKPRTLTIIKVKDSEEILGGYNPIQWDPDYPDHDHDNDNKDEYKDEDEDEDEYEDDYNDGTNKNIINNKDSYIFSFDRNEKVTYLNNISHVIDKRCPAIVNPPFTAYFYEDLVLWGENYFNTRYCKQTAYDKPIRKLEEKFSIEEYEVFQIIKLT
ncbi:hypothetical protein RclHR1_08780005 [Rhizophagus clarus]|uniref:BTB/POZ protein n=1 Tax=Rhizophagus clarus TaxID=94130 RepID=A0A2Z6S296_9GLOM|nr:hypothetical protein RclHR1_08780005 [Rhizophagus clarus]GES96355.1 BTB/POZ protein [Rhizophagus clarus]